MALSNLTRKERFIKDKSALLLTGSPMCSACSQLQKMNVNKMDPDKYEDMLKKGVDHLRFLSKLYN